MTTIIPLTPDGFAPYGTALGFRDPDDLRARGKPGWFSAASDFWQEHDFSSGEAGAEILWVVYRVDDPRITQLEAHLKTEQALLPLTGAVIQIVALSRSGDGGPDPASVKAFRISPGQGIVMAPGCWHGTRVAGDGPVTCAMLTRASTTADLVGHLAGGDHLTESRIAPADITLSATTDTAD